VTDREPASASTPVLDISPEPEPGELAAISVAILALAAADAPSSGDPAPWPPAWRTAALREGTLGIAGGSRSGWGRPRPGWRP